MRQLRYTLIPDGPSDRALITVINWTITQQELFAGFTLLPQFAALRNHTRQSRTLATRLADAIQRFPCDLVFIHRDAEKTEKAARDQRYEEIAEAIAGLTKPYWVPVIPVRMTEAWLLIDAQAIRQAADNPNGSARLQLPRVSRLEALPDPKETLNHLLITASEKTGRRLAKFTHVSELAWRRGRVAELIEDYRPLRALDAFQAFEGHCRRVMRQLLSS